MTTSPTLDDATLEEMLQELDDRGHLFVWASVAVPDDDETSTRLTRSSSVSDAQALYMLERAADLVAKELGIEQCTGA
jgi:hypothetical protein